MNNKNIFTVLVGSFIAHFKVNLENQQPMPDSSKIKEMREIRF